MDAVEEGKTQPFHMGKESTAKVMLDAGSHIPAAVIDEKGQEQTEDVEPQKAEGGPKQGL